MLEIDFDEEPKLDTCEYSGKELTTLVRYIFEDDVPYGVYYAQFAKDHDRKEVMCLIGLGDWGDDTDPKEDRAAFSIRIWKQENGEWAVTVTDREESPWANTTFLGDVFDREEALQVPAIKEVFQITDHIVSEDQVIIDYFNA